MRAGVILGLASALLAQSPPDPALDPATVLAKARGKVSDRMENLPNYTCVETVVRQYLKRQKPPYPLRPFSCDQLSGEKHRGGYKLELESTDRLRLDVKVSNGLEIGSWAGASQFDQRSILDLTGGPFGTGQLGQFSDMFSNESASFRYIGSADGHYEYAFHVPENTSHYLTKAGKDWVATSYEGTFWVDLGSFDVVRLSVQSSQLSEESTACEATSTTDYHNVHIGKEEFLIPRQNVLHFLMKDSRETENVSTYTACHEFTSESTVRFDAGPEPAPSVPKALIPPLAIPAGLPFTLALATPIHADTAAAGDEIRETFSKAVLDPKSSQVLIPAKAAVHARIVRMQYWPGAPHRFVIGVLLETVDVGGVSSPLYARPEPFKMPEKKPAGFATRGTPIALTPPNQPKNVGTFVFFTHASHGYIVPAGFESKWLTAPPPAQ